MFAARSGELKIKFLVVFDILEHVRIDIRLLTLVPRRMESSFLHTWRKTLGIVRSIDI